MTLDQFVSNNRGTNGGKDWPRQMLTNIYTTIQTDEIKLSADGEVATGRWSDVLRKTQVRKTKKATPACDPPVFFPARYPNVSNQRSLHSLIALERSDARNPRRH
eukprot:1041447-Pyramimonas_sp.AAC.1